eukprot:403376688
MLYPAQSDYKTITGLAESGNIQKIFAIIEPSLTIIMFSSTTGLMDKAVRINGYYQGQLKIIPSSIAGYTGEKLFFYATAPSQQSVCLGQYVDFSSKKAITYRTTNMPCSDSTVNYFEAFDQQFEASFYQRQENNELLTFLDPTKKNKYVEVNLGSYTGPMYIRRVISDELTILSCLEHDSTFSLLRTQRVSTGQPFIKSSLLSLVLGGQLTNRWCEDMKIAPNNDLRLLTLQRRSDSLYEIAYVQVSNGWDQLMTVMLSFQVFAVQFGTVILRADKFFGSFPYSIFISGTVTTGGFKKGYFSRFDKDDCQLGDQMSTSQQIQASVLNFDSATVTNPDFQPLNQQSKTLKSYYIQFAFLVSLWKDDRCENYIQCLISEAQAKNLNKEIILTYPETRNISFENYFNKFFIQSEETYYEKYKYVNYQYDVQFKNTTMKFVFFNGFTFTGSSCVKDINFRYWVDRIEIINNENEVFQFSKDSQVMTVYTKDLANVGTYQIIIEAELDSKFFEKANTSFSISLFQKSVKPQVNTAPYFTKVIEKEILMFNDGINFVYNLPSIRDNQHDKVNISIIPDSTQLKYSIDQDNIIFSIDKNDYSGLIGVNIILTDDQIVPLSSTYHLTINVYPKELRQQMSLYKQFNKSNQNLTLRSWITKIYNNGSVLIGFNNKMNVPSNLTWIKEFKSLSFKVSDYGQQIPNAIMDWEVQYMTQIQLMLLIHYQKQEGISSTQQYSLLQIEFIETLLFFSNQNGIIFLEKNTTFNKQIPPQKNSK